MGRGLDRTRPICAAAAAVLLCISGHGHAQEVSSPPDEAASALAGEYVHSQMEMVAGILLNRDGTFLYALTVGSLDERGKGRWRASGSRFELTSEPRPVAPTITPAKVETASGKPFALRVLSPDGQDVPGVDLLLEFDAGEPLRSYMTGEPWTLPPEEPRVPRFVIFSMPSYRLQSGRLPLNARAGTIATFTLVPNDFAASRT